ncbi:hypothetical protein [Citreicella sp. C3M06]|nr:hypothetical protein [Citreicella sp. C3M06]
MSNRAFVRVPGFGRKMRSQERDGQTVALSHYTDGWRGTSC